jgi:alkanesulfonate monooxygenase SsuD/methylene tetrahydromethanopterin reductase-like flavin-dependent oxidoreductase (luciferase family)
MAASIDEISGGRFILGLGAGWNEPEFRAFGIPFDRLASRYEESFTIIRRLLADERVTFDGKFHHADGAVLLPPPARRVRLMVGSHGPRVLRASLPHVDWWNAWYSWYGNTADGFARENANVDVLCREVGRDPEHVKRSACVLVKLEGASERVPEVAAIPVGRLAAALKEIAGAGADEAILVLDPITERTIRAAAEQIG